MGAREGRELGVWSLELGVSMGLGVGSWEIGVRLPAPISYLPSPIILLSMTS